MGKKNPSLQVLATVAKNDIQCFELVSAPDSSFKNICLNNALNWFQHLIQALKTLFTIFGHCCQNLQTVIL